MIKNQYFVQKNICNLIRISSFKSSFNNQLLDEMQNNGLCVGWVKRYFLNPESLRNIWELMSTIDFEGKDNKSAIDLIRNYSISNGSKIFQMHDNPIEEICSSIIFAWNNMDNSAYPKININYTPNFGLAYDSTLHTWSPIKKMVNCCLDESNDNNAAKIIDYIKSFQQSKIAKKVNEYICFIDTMIHHMCIHFKDNRIYLVETEEFGIGEVSSLYEVSNALNKELYCSNSSEPQTMDIIFYKKN